MKIVFYHDDDKGINLNNINSLDTSGTVSSLMWIVKGLSKLGHEIIVLNKSENLIVDNVTFISTDNKNQFIDNLKMIKSVDILVVVGGAGNIYHEFFIDIKVKIYWLHNYISEQEKNKFDDDISEGRLDRIICVSKYHLSTLSKIKNFKKCSYIYNSINFELIPSTKYQQKEKKLAFVGSITESKGLHNILKVVDKLYTIRQDFKFYIYGSANLYSNQNKSLGKSGIAEFEYEEKYLKQYLFKENTDELNDYIVLKGSLNRNLLYKDLNQIYLCLQDLNWDGSSETFGVGALEEQALGIPVITNFRGGQPEVIENNKTGFYIKRQNIMETIKSIENILDMKEEDYITFFKNSINNSKKFSYEIIAKEWESDLRKLLVNKNKVFVLKLFQAILQKIRIRIGI
jgi:glycosyltransferase involved in cell wall biosynthesis